MTLHFIKQISLYLLHISKHSKNGHLVFFVEHIHVVSKQVLFSREYVKDEKMYDSMFECKKENSRKKERKNECERKEE